MLDGEEHLLLEEAEDVAIEEDEVYRVRSAVVTSIVSICARDDHTPAMILRFLETVLLSRDGAALKNVSTMEDNTFTKKCSGSHCSNVPRILMNED